MKRPTWLGDPFTSSMVMFGSLIVAGFVAIRIGWVVAARTLVVPFQIPPLVSGGLGGFFLVMTGASLANIQIRRRLAAAERAETEALLDEATALLNRARESRRLLTERGAASPPDRRQARRQGQHSEAPQV